MVASDDRRTAAIGAGRAWYELTYGLQGKRFRTTDDLWIAADPPPPWHSGALTLRPGLTAERVAETLGQDFAGSVADNYAELDLGDHGFVILFEATWIHAPAPRSADSPAPDGWSVLDSPGALTDWNDRHDYHGVLTEPALRRPDLRILARSHDDVLTGGAVLHRTGEVVAVSNVWSDTEPGGWPEIMIMAALHFPGRALVGYERDQDLTDALGAGFTPVGPHRVWRRTDAPTAGNPCVPPQELAGPGLGAATVGSTMNRGTR